jgi:hypothetical protein
LYNLNAEVDINGAWETIRENIKISAKDSLGCYELKKHNTWLDGKCQKLLEELHKMYSSPSITRLMKLRMMRWAGDVARNGRGMNTGFW